MNQPALYYCALGLWPCLTQSEWAAWTQATGSIVAIGVAIAVPAAQHWLDRLDRKHDAMLRARSLAMAVHIEFQGLGKCLNNVWSFEHQDSFRDIDSPSLGMHTRSALSIPPRLAQLSDRLHELGPAGKTAQRCLFNLARAREYVTNDDRGQEIIFNKEPFYDRLWGATEDCTRVLNGIDAMF
jgi:hypothetical protein